MFGRKTNICTPSLSSARLGSPFCRRHMQLTHQSGLQPTRTYFDQRLSARRRHGRYYPRSYRQRQCNDPWPPAIFGVFAFEFMHRMFCIGGACVYLHVLRVRMRAWRHVCLFLGFCLNDARAMAIADDERVMPTPEIILPQQTFQRVGSTTSARRGAGAGGGGGGSGTNTARSGQFYAGQDPAIIASKAVEERVRRLEIQVNNFDKGMAKCLSQIVRLLQGLY